MGSNNGFETISVYSGLRAPLQRFLSEIGMKPAHVPQSPCPGDRYFPILKVLLTLKVGIKNEKERHRLG